MDRTGVAVCGWIVERQDRRRSRNRRDGKNIAAVVASASPDRIAASVGARSGLVDDGGLDPEDRQRIENMAVGSVPFLKAGEAIGRVAAGPDEQARKYESQLEGDVAAALNIPLSDLKSDYSVGQHSVQFEDGLGGRREGAFAPPHMVASQLPSSDLFDGTLRQLRGWQAAAHDRGRDGRAQEAILARAEAATAATRERGAVARGAD